jgi:hypothetical protein
MPVFSGGKESVMRHPSINGNLFQLRQFLLSLNSTSKVPDSVLKPFNQAPSYSNYLSCGQQVEGGRPIGKKAGRRSGLQRSQNAVKTCPVRCPGTVTIVPPLPRLGYQLLNRIALAHKSTISSAS